MTGYFLKIVETEKAQLIFEYIRQLSPLEVKILIVITAVLIAVMTLKWFGIRILSVLLFVYLFAYVIHYSNFIDNYIKREQDHNEHMNLIESYMSNNEKGK